MSHVLLVLMSVLVFASTSLAQEPKEKKMTPITTLMASEVRACNGIVVLMPLRVNVFLEGEEMPAAIVEKGDKILIAGVDARKYDADTVLTWFSWNYPCGLVHRDDGVIEIDRLTKKQGDEFIARIKKRTLDKDWVDPISKMMQPTSLEEVKTLFPKSKFKLKPEYSEKDLMELWQKHLDRINRFRKIEV